MLKLSKTKRLPLLTVLVFMIYTLGIDMILGAEFVSQWSDLQYEILIVVLKLSVAIGALWVLWHYGNQEVFRFQFKWRYLGYFILIFIVDLAWSLYTFRYFPRPMNQVSVDYSYEVLDQLSIYVEMFGLIVIAPLVEEAIFRGLMMESLSPWKRYYIDVMISSALFSIIHIMEYGWLFTDFIYYFVPGVLLALYFRKTNCLYYVLFYHIFWNSIPSWIRIVGRMIG